MFTWYSSGTSRAVVDALAAERRRARQRATVDALAADLRRERLRATVDALAAARRRTRGTVTRTRSLTAAAAPVAPPADWFDDAHLSEPTPLTIDADGRIWGHLASWATCHLSTPEGPGTCTVAPHSARGYADFHTGTVLTEEGTLVTVGKITMGTGHAKPSLTASPTVAHYDNTGTAVADVHAGEDQHGIWVSGALRPDVTPEQVRALRASPLSGDWRPIAGGLELVAALAVNVPGFPVPHPAGLVAAGGKRLYSLVAAGTVAQHQAALLAHLTRF